MPRFDPHVHTLTLLSKRDELDTARRAADAPTERPPRAIEYTVAYLHGDKDWLRSIARGAPCFALADEPGIVGVGDAAVVYGADVGSVVALAQTVAKQRVVMVLPRDADPAAALALARAETGKLYLVTQLPGAGEWSEVRVVTDNTGAVSVHVAPVVEMERPASKASADRRRGRQTQNEEGSARSVVVSGAVLPSGVNALGDVVMPEAMALMAEAFNATPADADTDAPPSADPNTPADADLAATEPTP